MANGIFYNGSTGTVEVTGSMSVQSGITASLLGTASYIDVTGSGLGINWNGSTLQLTASAGGGGTPGGSTTQIQYNNAGAFAGVPTLTYDGTTLRATGSFTGSLRGTATVTGSLLGTSSYSLEALTSSFALTSSVAQVAQANNSIVYYSGSSLITSPVPSWNSGSFTTVGLIRASARQSDGSIIIGGQIASVNGTSSYTYQGGTNTVSHLARITPDGNLDTTFKCGSGVGSDPSFPAASPQLYTIAIDTNDKIYIGGEYTLYSGSKAGSFLRLNKNGDIDTTFYTGDTTRSGSGTAATQWAGLGFANDNATPSSAGTVQDIVVTTGANASRYSSSIVVVGSFGSYAGLCYQQASYQMEPRRQRGIVMLDQTGSILRTASFDNGMTNATATNRGCNNGTNIIEFATSMSAGGTGNNVTSGFLLACNGSYRITAATNQLVNCISSSGANISTPSAFNALVGTSNPLNRNQAVAVEAGTNKIYVALANNTVNSGSVTVHGLIKLNASGTIDTTFNVTNGGTVSGSTTSTTIVVTEPWTNKVYLAGNVSMNSWNNVSSSANLFRLTNSGSLDTSFLPATRSLGFDTTVWNLLPYSQNTPYGTYNNVLVGGVFNAFTGSAGPQPANGVTLLNDSGSVGVQLASFKPGVSSVFASSNILTQYASLQFANDAAAAAGGVQLGGIYVCTATTPQSLVVRTV